MSAIRTGRRCDACRQRKKKCDQRQPSCLRCVKLGITCVGSGEQSLRFVGVNTILSKRSGPGPNGSSFSSSFTLGRISPSPSNELTLLRGSFTSVVQCDYPRYSLGLMCTLLEKMPKRFGSNTALDSFADAIVHAHAAYVAGSPSTNAIRCFTKALGVLRTSLEDPIMATSLETLAAIYLMLVAHLMIGTCFNAANGEGLAYLVNAAADRIDEQDSFANEIIAGLSSQLICESIVNSRIKLSPRVIGILRKRDELVPYHSLRTLQYYRLPDFINDPIKHSLEIRSSHQSTGLEVQRFQQGRLAAVLSMPPEHRAAFYTTYSMVLSYAILLNTLMLRSVEPSSRSPVQESRALLDEVLILLEDAKEFRPAAIATMGSMLFCAWPNDPSRKPEIEQRLSEFLGDFPLVRFKESARWLDRLLGPANQPAFGSIVTIEELERPSDACTVM